MESTLWFLQVLPSAYNALLGFTQSLMVRLADSRTMILVTYWFLVQCIGWIIILRVWTLDRKHQKCRIPLFVDMKSSAWFPIGGTTSESWLTGASNCSLCQLGTYSSQLGESWGLKADILILAGINTRKQPCKIAHKLANHTRGLTLTILILRHEKVSRPWYA